MTAITYHHLKAYQRWRNALSLMCTAYRALQGVLGTTGEAKARDVFQEYAKRIDSHIPPLGWRSWEHLGDAIHGPAYRPKTW